MAFVVSLMLTVAAQAAEKNTTSKPAAEAKAAAPKAQNKGAANGQITEAKALELVKNLAEVKTFFKNVGKSKVATPTIDVDRKEGNAYVVHVYEVVSDGPDSSHTATMNWFHVDIKTGKIKKEF